MKNYNHIHSLNISVAKQKYSFPKARRFSGYQPTSDVYYGIDIGKDRRSAIIGYGKKSLGIYQDKQLVNQPHAYSIPSTIEEKKGYSFKPGRHNRGSPLEQVKLKAHLPGPNLYDKPSTLDNKGPTLKQRLPDFSLKHLNGIPGPGAYSIPTSLTVNDQKVIQSKYSSAGSIRLAPLYNSLDLPREKHVNPGPGEYNILKYGLGNAISPLNKNENTKFGRGNRPGIITKDADKMPGPGLQQEFIQFSNIYSEFDS